MAKSVGKLVKIVGKILVAKLAHFLPKFTLWTLFAHIYHFYHFDHFLSTFTIFTIFATYTPFCHFNKLLPQIGK